MAIENGGFSGLDGFGLGNDLSRGSRLARDGRQADPSDASRVGVLRHGDHLCSFHSGAGEDWDLVVAFVGEALGRGEGCLYVADDHDGADIGARLGAAGIDVTGAQARGALIFAGKGDWRAPGEFGISAMAATVRELLSRAGDPGWGGMWVVVDMAWALDPDIDPERLAEWESYWNVLRREKLVVLLCRYNAKRMAASTINWELRTHPLVVVGGRVVRNSYFEPPEVFESRDDRANLLWWKLQQLTRAEQEQREGEERYRLLVERCPDAIVVHQDEKFVYVNPAAVELFAAAGAEELLGRSIYDVVHADYHAKVRARVLQSAQERRVADLHEVKDVRLDGIVIDVEAVTIPTTYQGKPAVQAIIRDVTARRQAEEGLKRRAVQQRTLAEIGQVALNSAMELRVLMDAAVTRVQETLGADVCCLQELLPDGTTLLARAVAGWPAELVGKVTSGPEQDSLAEFLLHARDPVIIRDLAEEDRFTPSPILMDNGMTSGISVIINRPREPYGLLSVFSRSRRAFTLDETDFVQSVANVIGLAIERKRTEVSRSRVGAILRDLQQVGKLRPAAMYQAGEQLAADVEGADLSEYLRVYADMGMGSLHLASDEDTAHARWSFAGAGLVEVAGFSPQPTCEYTRGFLSRALRRLTGKPIGSVEVACQSRGDALCRFVAAVTPALLEEDGALVLDANPARSNRA